MPQACPGPLVTAGPGAKDWLETVNTRAATTVTGYRIMAGHLTGLIGQVKLAG